MLWGQYSLGRKPDLHWFRLFRVLLLSYLVEALWFLGEIIQGLTLEAMPDHTGNVNHM